MIRRATSLVVVILPLLAGASAAQNLQQMQLTAEEAERLDREARQKAAEKAERDAELKSIEDRLSANAAARAKLEGEIAAIRADRAKLNAELIATTQRTQDTENRIGVLEQRLERTGRQATAIRGSLEARRGLIADVLAALQRIGRKPPPAVLVRPEDILEAVRSSMLLGAVVPELRSEIETLGRDLAELTGLTERITQDKAAIRKELEGLAGERQRLASLVEARRLRETAVQSDTDDERRQGQTLAGQARTLRELTERIEREVTVAARAAETARAAIESQTREVRERMAQLAFRDPARLQPSAAFSDLRGRLPLPVAGEIVRGFGQAEAGGPPLRGVSFVTQRKAVISAPCDGWVVFAGPYRSYGQLVILNAGSGHYMLLAGMNRIDVTLGQFVLAGEPIAVMGERQEAAPAAVGVANGEPILYVELKRDGTAIDPGPWWGQIPNRRAGG